ncbi:hypothetical protein [Eisenbergiella sp.]
MIIQNEEFGRIEVRDIPISEGDFSETEDFYGTYTWSGRVLVSGNISAITGEKDWYHVITVQDDGTDRREVFKGQIPQLEGANGIRWMCCPDNKRILLGDYVLECEPDIDRCESARLVQLVYPAQLAEAQGIFCRWSEIIIAPDNEHMCWTTLTMTGAVNYLGRLVKKQDCYVLEDVCIVSTTKDSMPDPAHEGCVLPLPVRGGEVKQFIRGGRALTMVGNGDSITESVVQPLDSEEIIQITHTPGYEETTIFSPDERLGVVMSPRFSYKTNCAVFGLVPQPYSMAVRSKVINIFYMYCVSGVRVFRKGNVGPVLITIEKSRSGGRSYQGVDLSDPEGRWVYYSPISWHPDSTRAMWNERTRPMEDRADDAAEDRTDGAAEGKAPEGKPLGGLAKCRLRMCRLLDREAAEPVPAAVTPSAAEIPYAVTLDGSIKQQTLESEFPMKIMGKAEGYVVNDCRPGNPTVCETVYHNFSDDGKTFFNGRLDVSAPASMFAPGETVFCADLKVSGEHSGEMKLRAVFRRDGIHAPAMLSFAEGADGLPESRGYSSYDGVTMKIEDMEP